MFLPGCAVLKEGSADFTNAREGMRSPLARKLFGIDGVQSVFFGADFVTVRKSEDKDWASLLLLTPFMLYETTLICHQTRPAECQNEQFEDFFRFLDCGRPC